MLGLDEILAHLGGGGAALMLVAALLLGARHATDPDHLMAVSTLVAGGARGTRSACALGLAWGTGHAATLFAFGVPLVLFGSALPGWGQAAVEAAIGAVIVLLALRLLIRWARRRTGAPAALGIGTRAGRTPFAAFSLGLLHGAGGSAAAGALLVGMASGGAAGIIGLGVFAAGTAVSMAACSALFGRAMAPAVAHPQGGALVVPLLGAASVAFGAWYIAAALAAAPS